MRDDAGCGLFAFSCLSCRPVRSSPVVGRTGKGERARAFAAGSHSPDTVFIRFAGYSRPFTFRRVFFFSRFQSIPPRASGKENGGGFFLFSHPAFSMAGGEEEEKGAFFFS